MTDDPLRKPQRLLYSIAAHIGGSGLGRTAVETLIAAENGGYLSRAIGYGNKQSAIPRERIRSLQRHPIKLAGVLRRADYQGAKRHYLDWITARDLARGDYDLFHGWSGESLLTLREARRRGIPSVLDIPTWHRNKGRKKPHLTKTERERLAAPFPRKYLNRLWISRQRMLEEYELAIIIVVQSRVAEETFYVQGIEEDRVVNVGRGVDPEIFTPGTEPPEKFQALFVGSISRRKGVDKILEAWTRLGWSASKAELVLLGDVQDDMRDALREHARDNVILPGFTRDVPAFYRRASVFVFPSTCEGSAKATFEAGASGLPSISTRESGDFVVDGENGVVVPVGESAPIAEALEYLYENPEEARRMGGAARQRILDHFTWDHYREKLEQTYAKALSCG